MRSRIIIISRFYHGVKLLFLLKSDIKLFSFLVKLRRTFIVYFYFIINVKLRLYEINSLSLIKMLTLKILILNLKLFVYLIFVFILFTYSEPISSSKQDPFESKQELMMSSNGNKRTFSTSSNTSTTSASYCVTLGVGPLWYS